MEKAEHWGTRKLAYRVAKHREGMYYYQQIRTSHPDLIAELERRLRVLDAVIKYQTVRLDEDLKRQKKLVEKREKRTARRPRRATTPAVACRQRLQPLPKPRRPVNYGFKSSWFQKISEIPFLFFK